MKPHIQERTISGAQMMLEGHTTRQVAKALGTSQCTIARDMHENLPKIDGELHQKVLLVLAQNKQEAAKRGGSVTWKNYHAGKHKP